MKILSRKRQEDMDSAQLTQRLAGRFPVHIDIGTGSGRMMLNYAKQNAQGLYIGLDPCPESMHESSARAVKQRTENLLFVVASIEKPPDELAGIADAVSVILPWGSLRNGIVKAEPLILRNIRMLGKPGAELAVLIGYDEAIEADLMAKQGLPCLSSEYFFGLKQAYYSDGIQLRSIKAIGNAELKQTESDWAKRLAYGKPRNIYALNGICI